MPWPPLTEARDGPTIAALHLYSQILGKAAVALLPWRNHGWHVTLRVHPRGLRTEPLYGPGGPFELGLDLAGHEFTFADGSGIRRLALQPTTVAQFHNDLIELLKSAGHEIRIHPATNELDPPVRFAEDDAPRAYDRDSAQRLLGALLDADRVFRLFRSSFLGKVSPVHFFWGSFDLAVTRFSGRPAPVHPGGIPHLPDEITREAYSHEVSSAGFWPGGAGGGGDPFFYSYAYPSPEGFAQAPLRPAAARFDEALGEFVLPYAEVRTDADLLLFLESTYGAAADLAGWDRPALECDPGLPGVPRRL
ncbi:MAG TPA: DUF5996 family protein [Allosphingosinicella sp.]|jgi:hypothetical protein